LGVGEQEGSVELNLPPSFLGSFAATVTTKYHIWVVYTTEIYFLTFLDAKSPK
jgi:hypothetical protein